MKQKIKDYMEKVESAISDYMQKPVSPTTASAVENMVECWEHLKAMSRCYGVKLDYPDIVKWVDGMSNDDGSAGGYWSMSQTTEVAESIGLSFDHITEAEWYAAMNMMYSDYCTVADKYGISIPEFYADLAKAFLFDKDGGKPKEKLGAYYCNIVDREE